MALTKEEFIDLYMGASKATRNIIANAIDEPTEQNAGAEIWTAADFLAYYESASDERKRLLSQLCRAWKAKDAEKHLNFSGKIG